MAGRIIECQNTRYRGSVTRNHVPPPEGIQVEGLVYATSVLGGGKPSHPECLGDAIKPGFHGVGAL